MGILGTIKLARRTREVTLGLDEATGKEIKALVTAPALQLTNDLQQRIPAPKPPILLNDAGKPRFKTHPRTGEAIKEKGQLVPMLNWNDPDYLVDVSSVERARTIAMIFECTTFPGEPSVDKDKNGSSPIACELARWKELEDEGCGIGVYNDLSSACLELSESMTKSEIEEARRALGVDKKSSDEIKERLGKDAPKGK